MKILVTGGAGFIGSHLVDALVKEHDVIVLDDLSTGKSERLNPNAKFVSGSIVDSAIVKNVMNGCKAVFHLAAQTEVRKSVEDPRLDYQINVVGSKNVFQAAEEVGAKIIFASSAAVYGKKAPASESDPLKPISAYGRNKAEAEKSCPRGSFIARLFNVCGPRGHGAVNVFCEALQNGKEIMITGTGNQTRDFVHVEDAVRALMLGLTFGGTFNVGTGKSISIIDTLRIIEEVVGRKAKVRFVPAAEGDILHSIADTRKIRQLGWKPEMTSEEAVKETAKTHAQN